MFAAVIGKCLGAYFCWTRYSPTFVDVDDSGVGGVLVFSPSYVAVSQWFDKKKGKAMALSTIGTGFGNVCMAPLIALLVDQYNYFGTMLIIGALLFNSTVGGALYRAPPELPGKVIISVDNMHMFKTRLRQVVVY